MKETPERMLYRMKCKHHGMYDKCFKKSGWFGNCHVSIGCDPDTKCDRMKRYDKLYGK